MTSLSCINASFVMSDGGVCDERNHNIDLEMATKCFNEISKIEHSSILDTVGRQYFYMFLE